MQRLLVALLFTVATFPALADDALLQRPDIKKALAYIESSHEKTLATQVTIAEIPAPTFHEAERAKYMAEQFRLRGLKNVEIDKTGQRSRLARWGNRGHLRSRRSPRHRI